MFANASIESVAFKNGCKPLTFLKCTKYRDINIYTSKYTCTGVKDTHTADNKKATSTFQSFSFSLSHSRMRVIWHKNNTLCTILNEIYGKSTELFSCESNEWYKASERIAERGATSGSYFAYANPIYKTGQLTNDAHKKTQTIPIPTKLHQRCVVPNRNKSIHNRKLLVKFLIRK